MTYADWQTRVAPLPAASPLAQALHDWTVEREILLALIALYHQFTVGEAFEDERWAPVDW